jgi:hypothetical protein
MIDKEVLERLATFPYLVVSWVGDDGYPVQTPADFEVDPGAGSLVIRPTAVALPTDRSLNIIASHIRPQPGYGYDERRYIQLWGEATASTVDFAPVLSERFPLSRRQVVVHVLEIDRRVADLGCFGSS